MTEETKKVGIDLVVRADFLRIINDGVKMLPPLIWVKRWQWLPEWLSFNYKLDYLWPVSPTNLNQTNV